MPEMLESLSIFIGTGQCNAKCAHCAGLPHRKAAPKEDGVLDAALIRKTLQDCYVLARKNISLYSSPSLSLSSSGEPTLSPESVSEVLNLVYDYSHVGVVYSPINLYTNGIRIGTDEEFCNQYLPTWRFLGLTTLYVTVHDLDPKKNAAMYGVAEYPPLETIVKRIHDAGMKVRANLVLNKRAVGTPFDFAWTVKGLRALGFDTISAWCLRDANDKIDADLAPSESELDEMERWAIQNPDRKCPVRIYRETNRGYQEGRKLTLFPDGTLSNTWCK